MLCPKCGTEISSLIYIHGDVVQEELTLNDGMLVYEELSREVPLGNSPTYCCPDCKKELFETENEAVGFLKGDRVP